jgi:hypothetical protein
MHIKANDSKIIELIKFVSPLLMSKRLLNNISVEVVFESLEENISGFCEWEYDNIRPRDFIITLQKNSVDMFDRYVTICHELVHIKQFAKSELKDRFLHGKFMTIFHDINYGNSITRDSYKVDDCVFINDFPWEIEAINKQFDLFYAWYKTKTKEDLKMYGDLEFYVDKDIRFWYYENTGKICPDQIPMGVVNDYWKERLSDTAEVGEDSREYISTSTGH